MPELAPLMGVRAWEYATETTLRASCGICKGGVSGDFICLGCLTVSAANAVKLASRRHVADRERKLQRKPAPAFRGKGASVSALTAKERRAIVKDYKRTQEGRAWLKSQGLLT